jgi:hypothetical protein
MKIFTDSILTQIFPHTYPIYVAYDNKLIEQAADIKRDPSSYPVLNRMGSLTYLQKMRHSKWNEPFKGFLEQSASR